MRTWTKAVAPEAARRGLTQEGPSGSAELGEQAEVERAPAFSLHHIPWRRASGGGEFYRGQNEAPLDR